MPRFDFREMVDRVNADGAMVDIDGILAGMCVRLELLHQGGPAVAALLMFEPFYDQSVNYMHRLAVQAVIENSPGEDDRATLELDTGARIRFVWPAGEVAWRNWLRYKAEHGADLEKVAVRAITDQRALT